MMTLTLQEQMQVIFDKLEAPAVIDADCVVIESAPPSCDGIIFCTDCLLRDTPDCAEYQAHLTDIGRGNDATPNFWDAGAPAPTTAVKIARIERILGDTQGRRGSNPHYAVNVLDAGPLCYVGK